MTRMRTVLLIMCMILFLGKLQAQTVERLVLINATTNSEIRDLPPSGDTIDLDLFPLISFRAVTNPEPLGAGQCVFQLSYPGGAVYNHSEGTSVYACFGDLSGNYNDWESGYNSPPPIEEGSYSLKITPGAGVPSTFGFVIVGSGEEPDEGEEPGGGEAFDTLKVSDGEILLRGELKQWHDVEMNLGGPVASEGGHPNPFSDYRLQATFTKGSRSLIVPGYFATDGNAHETGATEGNVWRIHFCPPETGTWSYEISFRSGTDVAISDDETAGDALAPLDGMSGSIEITESDKTGRDLRGKGRLSYVGAHHLQFAGTGQWFLKAGADAPENFLAYEGFDNSPDNGGRRKTWGPHIQDWREGDPLWQGSKGKGIIGAVNYLASKGMNVFSFLTMNAPQGDDKNVFMWLSPYTRDRFDCSKLDQWEIVFTHAESKGMYLHFKTQETENEMLLDNGDVGRFRKLYYRELIARYAHHLALNWNLGEENGDLGDTNQNTTQRIAMAQYFSQHDPYENLIVIHTAGGKYDEIYGPLLGFKSDLTGTSLQTWWGSVHDISQDWVTKSAAAGKKWVVASDEVGSADIGVAEDAYTGTPNKNDIRSKVLWGNLMAGGAGVEYYFGYQRPESDLTCEDYRSRDRSWDYCKVALDFFNLYLPYWEMQGDDDLTTSGYCLAKPGEVYAVYLENGGTASVKLGEGSYDVFWYNPREGGSLLAGTDSLVGGGWVSMGPSPSSGEDWVALVREQEFSHPGNGAELYPCGDDIVLSSISDFPDYNVNGFRPAYKDEGKQVLAIDASQYKDEYAAAVTTSALPSGIYNVTITTLTELDGESTYRLVVNGSLIGTFTNPETTTDYAPVEHTWENVELNTGDQIQVEFNSHTNGKIPEGEITAYSRGRWKQLAFTPMCNQGCTDGDAFEEKDGYVIVEMESALDMNSYWGIYEGAGSLGAGYIVYESADHMGSVAASTTLVYKVQINTPGTYQFLWRTRRGFNTPAADQENDSWLKINGSDFYGMKNSSKVASKDHFMKVWIQKDVFSWDCWGEHSGQNGLTIFADFDVAGEYTIEVSGRSRNHVIDRMALFLPAKKQIALDPASPQSPIGCGGHTPTEPPKPVEPDIIHVTDMYVAYDALTMIAGEDYLLRSTILPDSAEIKDMLWSVQQTSVVTVDSSGLISAVEPGVSRVYAATADGGIRDYCTVVVLPARNKVLLDKAEWSVLYADSEDSEKDGGVKENSIDGDTATFWHTQWFSAQAPLPHELQIDLGSQQYIDIVEYYPRQDLWGPNGAIGAYELYVSNNPSDWGTPVHKGNMKWAKLPTREDYMDMRRIFLNSPAKGQYFKIVALSEAQNNPEIPFTAIAELDLWAYVRDLTGMEEAATDALPEVYPNPFKDYIRFSNLEHVESLELFHMDGREVASIPLSGLPQYSMKTEDLEAGSYFLFVNYRDGSKRTMKLLKL